MTNEKTRAHCEAMAVEAANDAVLLAMAKSIASSLEFRGWATGGDYETDFLPDVLQALRIAMLKAREVQS